MRIDICSAVVLMGAEGLVTNVADVLESNSSLTILIKMRKHGHQQSFEQFKS